MTALATIHVGKKQLGLDEDTYRGLLHRVTGKTSSADMSEAERHAVIEEMRRKGFKPRSNGIPGGVKSGMKLSGKYAGKLQALWIGAWNLGLIRHRTDDALIAFVKRQTGIDHVRFVRHAHDASAVIEALKGWMAREGKVDWSADPLAPDWADAPGYRIAIAQWVKVSALYPDLNASFQQFAERLAGVPVPKIGKSGWQSVMNELGRMIREAQ